jgi:8-oxo-dGTP diphosphatase
MTLHLVRHAKAGSRSAWTGDDLVRPLSNNGWAQAAALAERLALSAPPLLVSSRYVRCIQTLEPLAERLGLPITTDDRLFEGAGFVGALELLEEVPDGTVLCSHGDVIPETIDALVRRGLEIETVPDWRKASVWELDRQPDGRITNARCLPPPPR